jgi:hypothetical protein
LTPASRIDSSNCVSSSSVVVVVVVEGVVDAPLSSLSLLSSLLLLLLLLSSLSSFNDGFGGNTGLLSLDNAGGVIFGACTNFFDYKHTSQLLYKQTNKQTNNNDTLTSELESGADGKSQSSGVLPAMPSSCIEPSSRSPSTNGVRFVSGRDGASM